MLCLSRFCKPFQSEAIDLSDSCHNLASFTKVKQNLWTLTPSVHSLVSIQSFFLRRCASASSSGLPANSHLLWDHFNYGIGLGWAGETTGCVVGTAGCAGGPGGCTGGRVSTAQGITGGGWGVGGLPSAISSYVLDKIDCVTRNEPNSIPNNIVTDWI